MQQNERKPAVVVFAGPNGSGKSTITKMFPHVGVYINADEIQRQEQCDPYYAAECARVLRERCVQHLTDFTFETVMSTRMNLDLLKRAKDQGYFIKCFFILTCSSDINVARVQQCVKMGYHDVPVDKIRSRYKRSLDLLSELIGVCDIINVYDNSTAEPFRIFSKKINTYRIWEGDLWDREKIAKLIARVSFEMFESTVENLTVYTNCN